MSVRLKVRHLQSLRAIAASLVVADHALEYPIRRQILGEDNYAFAWILGWIGVAVFFAISGLIMVRSSRDSFGSLSQARRFGARRILRIIPLYWLATLIFLIVSLTRTNAVDLAEFIKSLLFVPYWSPRLSSMKPIVGQGWTLNYEMMFYAIFALALMLKRGWGLALIFIVLVGLVGCHLVLWPPTPYLDPVTPLQFWTDPIIILFALGMIVAQLEQRSGRWLEVPCPIVCSLALILLCVSAFVILGGTFPLQIYWQLLFAAVAICCVHACASGSAATVGRTEQVLEIAGDASYSTYLVHPLVLMVFATVWGVLPRSTQDPAAFVVVSILLCNLVGYFIHVLVERPLGEKLGQFTAEARTSAKRSQLTA
ncbi:acyltransferase family protein [Bradyrhizobium sp. PMVTL-01]|uniref:acyltransferase family protein n=1 Tax=Bradyrhizobium sp. PMVTL-01 TaxID=3434999 RepID=UPI003F7257E1